MKILRLSVFQKIAACLGIFLATAAHAQNNLTIALARNTITPAEETFTIAVPKQLGYFKEEGISVAIITTSGSTAALQAVANGSADIAYASSTTIASAVERGIPVKAFAGITVQWPYFIGVPQGSAIKTIADLKGRRIGVISLASASYADLKANLHLAGLSEDDVTIVAVGAGARAAAALRNNEIDAVDSYSDSFTVMRQNGVTLTLLPRPAEMEKLFSVTMVTSTKMLQERPQDLVRFVRAAYKGIIYTQLYPESALALSFAEYPQLAGSSDPGSQDARNTLEAMRIALGDSIPKDNADPATWGQWLNISNERWDALLKFAYQTGQIETQLTPAQVWDGSLMPQIYPLDIHSIVEKK